MEVEVDAIPELRVPALSPTERLVSIPSIPLRDASSGATPRLRTAVRVAMRGGDLLVRFDGRDEGAVATLTRRDDSLWTEDVFEAFVTPFDPPNLYFEFEINPLGALFDARVTSPDLVRKTMNVDIGWDLPGLRGRSHVRPDRWSATLKIPIETLLEGKPFPRNWRANFYRVDRGSKDEFSAWSPIRKEPADFHEAGRFGYLRFPPKPSC